MKEMLTKVVVPSRSSASEDEGERLLRVEDFVALGVSDAQSVDVLTSSAALSETIAHIGDNVHAVLDQVKIIKNRQDLSFDAVRKVMMLQDMFADRMQMVDDHVCGSQEGVSVWQSRAHADNGAEMPKNFSDRSGRSPRSSKSK